MSTAKSIPATSSDAWVREYAADGRLKGVILSGSHASVYEETTDKAPQAVFELGVPVLGICYGMQTMAHQLGGKVEGGHKREFGYAAVRARGHTELLRDIADYTTPEGHGMLNVWMSHGDKVDRDAARLQADGLHRQLPDRRHGRRGARFLRDPVPCRGDAHACRAGPSSSASCWASARRVPTG